MAAKKERRQRSSPVDFTGRLTFSVTEFAELLGISRATAYQMIRTESLPVIHIGRRTLISRTAIEGLLGPGVLGQEQDRSPSAGIEQYRRALEDIINICRRALDGLPREEPYRGRV